MQFTLLAPAAVQSAPFCLGYAFRRGDIPAGSTVVSDYGTLQVTPRNYWPDGSLKFAQLAGQADLAAGSPVLVTLRKATATSAGTALSLANLKSTGVVAEIGCGTFGTARWADGDWDSPFQTWVSGPTMSSWVYRKPVGSDPHLVAWLEVRLFAGGAVEVLPWVENGYLKVAGPVNKSATYSFKLGTTTLYSGSIDLPHHARTPLIDGTALSYWVGTDPGVALAHDTTYLQDTELVPTYMGMVPSTSSTITALVTTFKPLQQGNFDYQSDTMQSTGYASPIGLLPQHDVLYLIGRSSITYGAVIRNGFGAGRYGIHYRDETTNRPLRFSSHPTLVISGGSGVTDAGASSTSTYTPTPSGTGLPSWDGSHHPSVGFMAYLLTGRWYFMEEVQFAATLNYINITDTYRQFASGIPIEYRLQTRNAAWNFRTLAQALTATPDADTNLRNEFKASVEATIDYFHARYVAQANNPFGFVWAADVVGVAGATGDRCFMQDFFTGAYGYALAMNLPIATGSATKLSAFFAWKAKNIVGRLGTSAAADWLYRDAATYNIMMAPSASPDFVGGTGPWYANWGAVYAATYTPAPSWIGTKVDGPLRGEIMPGANSFWGNLQPAISYAVRHGVPGASAAYRRMVSAANWGDLEAQFLAVPVWGVKPSGASRPAWMSGKALNEWFPIPGTVHAGSAAAPSDDPADSGAASNRRLAYSGMALRDSEILLAACGGHQDYSGNEVTSIDISDDSPAWRLRLAATQSSQRVVDAAYYGDGLPSSRHTYWSQHWNPQRRRLMLHASRFVYGKGVTFFTSNGFNLDSNSWDAAGTWADGQGASCQEEGTGIVWAVNRTRIYKWTPDTDAWSQTGEFSVEAAAPMCHDSKRQQLFALAWGDGQAGGTGVTAACFTANGTVRTTITFEAGAALTQFTADQPAYAAMEYDAENDQYYFYDGQAGRAGRIYVITPVAGSSVWRMSILQLGSGSATPPNVGTAGVLSRFRYVRELKGFVLMSTGIDNLYFIRTA